MFSDNMLKNKAWLLNVIILVNIGFS